jgi:uncharacterized damage-inducible protein DinB
MNSEQIVQHVNYSAWASARLLEAASALTQDELNRAMSVSHGTVLGTLAHIYGGDRIWISRLTDAEPRKKLFDPGEEITIEALQRDWPQQYARLAGFLETADLAGMLHYFDTKGNAYQTPVWQVILHLVNHATLHRGQVMAMLRQLGKQPPPTDLIFYYRTLT